MGGYRAIPGLELMYILQGELGIGILRPLFLDIDHFHRDDQIFQRDLIDGYPLWIKMIRGIDMCSQVFMDMPGIGRYPILWDRGDGCHAEGESQIMNRDIGEFGGEDIGEVLQVIEVENQAGPYL